MGMLVILCLLSIPKIFAQLEDGPEPPPQKSINDFMIPLLLTGILVGGYFFYKENKKRPFLK